MQISPETPNELAQRIANENLRQMKKQDSNKLKLGGGVRQAQNMLDVVSRAGLCGDCVRFFVDRKKAFGTTNPGPGRESPTSLAGSLEMGYWLPQLVCLGYKQVEREDVPVITENGNVSWASLDDLAKLADK